MYNSRHKLFTSGQRFWIINEIETRNITYKAFIKNIISLTTKENGNTISRYLEKISGVKDDLALLGFIQHHGGPTPLIDFTRSVENALYFACQGEQSKKGSDDRIDNYISLYTLALKATNEDNLEDNFWDLPWKTLKRIKTDLSDADKLILDAGVRNVDLFFDEQLQFGINYLDDRILYDFQHRAITNMNILNQEGVFFFVNDPKIPFEELMEKHFGDGYTESSLTKFIRCIHIHKNLIPFILDTIDIDESFIFPNSYNMINNIKNKVLL